MIKNKKTRLILILICVALLVVITSIFYVLQVSNDKKAGSGALIPVLIPIIIVCFMIFFISRRYKDIKEGMPLEDERSKKVVERAGAKSFQFSLYWLLAISIFESFFAKNLFGVEKLDAGQTVGGAIFGMAILFFIFWFYYNKKSELL